MLEATNSTVEEKVNNIIEEVLNNVQELDLPVPLIDLTESQKLMDDVKIKDIIVDSIINNLDTLGYLDSVSKDDFKQILLGNLLLDTTTVEVIVNNINNVLYTKYWGCFSNLDDLTDHNIRQSYTDVFRTLDCTKIIDARGGKKIFFVLPSILKGFDFYVNGQKTELQNASVDLLLFDEFNRKIPYTLYYTEDGYNSASVVVEIRG